MDKKKLLGRSLMVMAVVLMVVGELLPVVMSLLATLGAMLVGGIGLYCAFDDTSGQSS